MGVTFIHEALNRASYCGMHKGGGAASYRVSALLTQLEDTPAAPDTHHPTVAIPLYQALYQAILLYQTILL